MTPTTTTHMKLHNGHHRIGSEYDTDKGNHSLAGAVLGLFYSPIIFFFDRASKYFCCFSFRFGIFFGVGVVCSRFSASQIMFALPLFFGLFPSQGGEEGQQGGRQVGRLIAYKD